MRKITADKIYTISNGVLENHVLILDDDGTILDITAIAAHDSTSMEQYEGVLVPGFINTHCHLELSHMKGRVPTGTGLIPFIKNVVQFRADFTPEQIQAAIEQADADMRAAGIVAVGDISNVTDTIATKSKSDIHYHTFVEMFDFMVDANAQERFDEYSSVANQYQQYQLPYTLVPHAPYSTSKKLFALINKHQVAEAVTVSIHNQEMQPENDLFLAKHGDLIPFYANFGIPIADWLPTKQTSIHYAMQEMDAQRRTLFVHNTLTSTEDIAATHAWNPRTYWATCPNANLYIENRLPRYEHFIASDAKMTIGTDSLTSNWQLSVLEELKTIARYQSFVPNEMLLQWATLNGAEALGLDDQLGSFEVGKRPGINLLSSEKITAETTVRRLV
jgi:cytosine/adenosine deaminase-related metal-dependent hydrolase